MCINSLTFLLPVSREYKLCAKDEKIWKDESSDDCPAAQMKASPATV